LVEQFQAAVALLIFLRLLGQELFLTLVGRGKFRFNSLRQILVSRHESPPDVNRRR
jgi:hypothetical protein